MTMLRLAPALLALLMLLPCSVKAKTITVVASFSILGDMVHEVGGDDVTIKTLVGPDSDAHVYEPTPADTRALANADLLVVNGLGFEGWMARLVESSGYHGHIVIVTQDVQPMMVNGAPDPHAWQSVDIAEVYAKNIRNALIKIDPVHTEDYRVNTVRYIRQLQALDDWARSQIAHVPLDKRRAIVSHDAFRYFAARYGINFLAASGTSTTSEPGARDLAELIDQIRASHVRAVFLENMSDPRMMQELVTEAGAVIGGTLYSDALSPPSGEAPTYIAMVQHNVSTLVKAMQAN